MDEIPVSTCICNAATKHYPEDCPYYGKIVKKYQYAQYDRMCEYCGRDFRAISGKKRFCSRTCGAKNRFDKNIV